MKISPTESNFLLVTLLLAAITSWFAPKQQSQSKKPTEESVDLGKFDFGKGREELRRRCLAESKKK